MNILYVRYGRNTVRVSKRWAKVLRAADRAGIRFTINSGHRTLREQTALYQRNMLRRGVPRPGRPLTAFPTPNAPHIFAGRAAHALDVNSSDGGETRLQRWLEKKGAKVTNPVRGESWHMVVSGRDLKRLSEALQPARKETRPMRTSTRGINLIAGFEGFRARAYRAVSTEKHLTIGYGHYGPDVLPNQVVTPAQAKVLLAQDVREAEAAVDRLVKVKLTQGQFDALVSFVFNVGAGAFASSTLLRLVNRRRWNLATAQFARWSFAGGRRLLGLARRRSAEAALFYRSRPR